LLALGTLVLGGCSGDKDGGDQASARRQMYAPENAAADEEEAVDEEFRYDPSDLPDPFKSYVRRNQVEAEDLLLSPLERFDLSQLIVTGIIWGAKNPRALIEDPTGKGYIVDEGTGIGKNKGRIVRIDDNRVIVKETYVDFRSKATSKEVELHLYERHGG
jgi:type IV pilus assembly protein PilP